MEILISASLNLEVVGNQDYSFQYLTGFDTLCYGHIFDSTRKALKSNNQLK